MACVAACSVAAPVAGLCGASVSRKSRVQLKSGEGP